MNRIAFSIVLALANTGVAILLVLGVPPMHSPLADGLALLAIILGYINCWSQYASGRALRT